MIRARPRYKVATLYRYRLVAPRARCTRRQPVATIDVGPRRPRQLQSSAASSTSPHRCPSDLTMGYHHRHRISSSRLGAVVMPQCLATPGNQASSRKSSVHQLWSSFIIGCAMINHRGSSFAHRRARFTECCEIRRSVDVHCAKLCYCRFHLSWRRSRASVKPSVLSSKNIRSLKLAF